MARRIRVAMGLGLLLCGLGSAHAAPPPPPRLPRGPSLRTTADAPLLQPQADGTLRHVDSEARFVGIVHPDGRVELRDVPDGRVELQTGVRTVDWMLGFVRAIERPGPHDRPDLETPTPDRDDETARLEAATVKIDHGPYGPPPILVSVGGRFGGVADLLLRRGQRTQARAKQAFLERTAPLRDALAHEHAQQQQREARLRLGQELATGWRDHTRSLAERKRELFERWDECEEAGDAMSETDATRGRGGEEMRRRIEAFVRLVAPPGSPQAFGAAELRRLNASRRSRQRFDPYGPREHDAARDDLTAETVAR